MVLAFSVLVVADPRADDAAHREEDSIAADADGVAHDVHVVEHTAAQHVLDPDEVLAEDLAVEPSQQTVLGVGEIADGSHGRFDVAEEG